MSLRPRSLDLFRIRLVYHLLTISQTKGQKMCIVHLKQEKKVENQQIKTKAWPTPVLNQRTEKHA